MMITKGSGITGNLLLLTHFSVVHSSNMKDTGEQTYTKECIFKQQLLLIN